MNVYIIVFSSGPHIKKTFSLVDGVLVGVLHDVSLPVSARVFAHPPPICESVLRLMYPFQWAQVYVPILPPMLENCLYM